MKNKISSRVRKRNKRIEKFIKEGKIRLDKSWKEVFQQNDNHLRSINRGMDS